MSTLMPNSHNLLGHARPHTLQLRRLGIDTHQELVVYMRQDCHICRSEGFAAQARIQVTANGHSIIATLGKITGDLLGHGEASLSESAWRLLGAAEGGEVSFSHPPFVESPGLMRGKIYGQRLDTQSAQQIIQDIVAGRYADVHVSAFITACSGRALNRNEMVALTRAMVTTGSRLDWGNQLIADKHCIGGLPGNRTTPIVVASPVAPQDLQKRAIDLATSLLELVLQLSAKDALAKATNALRKFEAICTAQGGLRTPPWAAHTHPVLAAHAGSVVNIDNRVLAKIAKLAGAPSAKAVGLAFHTPLGTQVEKGMPLFTVHAESRGELAYALEYVRHHPGVISLEADA